ncbi:tripartite motif-containing protein 16-like [Paramormyrops kingsleyae]|uniref:tripartite motif-containing protein 16-like n=1 Tax=Paramormyrops kingsleyae TaxID=1676925 RepID=UPI003B97AE15
MKYQLTLVFVQSGLSPKPHLLQPEKQEVPPTLTHRRLRVKMKLNPISPRGKMAEANVALDQNQFNCPICLDLLKDPVTIPCGHSYCMSCIKSCWDQEDHAGVYSCPQCKQTFIPRPVLGRNTILAEVVEKLKKTGLQAATPADHYAGPGDVECDVCTGRKHKAVKSCLVCLASYCETHLQPHYESPAFKKHKLTDATGRLQDKVCSQHDKPLEVYCRTDQQCICDLCTMYEHRGHDTVSAAAGRVEMQKLMGETQKEFQQRIQMREKELQELREAVASITSSTQSAVEDSERIFTEMIRSIERRRSEVTKLIRDQEKAAVSQAEGHMEILKQDIDELKRRHSELEQLSHTEDHIQFLQRCQDLPDAPEAGFGPRISVCPCSGFGNVKKVVSELKDELENVWKKKMAEIQDAVTKDTILPVLVPRTRAEFLQYSCQLTLDPNTAHRLLSLSEGNRKVTRGAEQPYPDHPERFEYWYQVLCRESLTGRCYWEAEWSGDGARIGVTYKGIRRKGDSADCGLGFNDKSWMLRCSPDSYSVRHNNKRTVIPIKPSGSRRVGVYLDWAAGTLSFYRVSSDGLTLLYSFTSSFTEPLCPGFWVNYINSPVSLCMLG